MNSPYDILIVGAGISSATVAACLKQKYKIKVVDVRNHIGGNCFDYQDKGTFIHQYGPHIFHSKSQKVVDFLSQFTEWTPYNYSVKAEIKDNDKILTVPFPYCKLTAEAIGRQLTEDEVLEKFFHGYSQKMWGMSWDQLPSTVKGRVPKDTKEKPVYFPDQFCAMPKMGFSHMIENMFDGVDIELGIAPDDWVKFPANKVVFCGRPDLIKIPGTHISVSQMDDICMGYRTLDMSFKRETQVWDHAVTNYCHLETTCTRKIYHAGLTGGQSDLFSTEIPKQADDSDLHPYYPIPTKENTDKFNDIADKVNKIYPNMILMGRLGTYKYLDMYQAVGQALSVVSRQFSS